MQFALRQSSRGQRTGRALALRRSESRGKKRWWCKKCSDFPQNQTSGVWFTEWELALKWPASGGSGLTMTLLALLPALSSIGESLPGLIRNGGSPLCKVHPAADARPKI
ncbi:MAG TPA: hypothetical protein DEF45_23895 [Rhodopirellula sp.]|nr:hypothetical protein [Rhodopirellula sp.]